MSYSFWVLWKATLIRLWPMQSKPSPRLLRMTCSISSSESPSTSFTRTASSSSSGSTTLIRLLLRIARPYFPPSRAKKSFKSCVAPITVAP